VVPVPALTEPVGTALGISVGPTTGV